MKKLYTFFFILFVALATQSSAQCPSYCFTASVTSGCKGLTVTFTNTSTVTATYYTEWSFGDGSPTYTMTVPTTTVSHTYTTTGNFNPYINVYDNTWTFLGNSYGSSGSIQINGLSSIGGPDSICPGDAANMCANTNMGGNFSTFWKFGDGATYNSNQSCANHTYTAQATYTATVFATVGSCPYDSVKKTIIAHSNARPDANWWTNGQSPFCPNQQIGFNTSSAVTYTWTFGDGGTSNLQQPTHTYTGTGTYSVTLAKTNSCGKTKASTYTLSISNTVTFPNQSWFKLETNGSPACPNSQLSFNAPGGYSDYEWNFGDGSPLQNTTQNYTNHTYGSTPGTYTASVKITNACNNDTTMYTTVDISLTAPFPNQPWFDLEASSPSCPNSNADFEAPSGFSIYEWNFGDGSPVVISSDNHERHLYGSPITTYTASVKITNGCNNDTTLYKVIQILPNVGFPQNNFQLYVNNPNCISNPVQISSPGGYVSYAWNFGDGSTATTSRNDVKHTYTLIGTYNASVTITNGCGNDTTISGSVVVDNTGSFPVNNNLNIELNPNNGQSCPNDIVGFSINSGDYSSYEWNFGDGTTATITGKDIQHSYTTTGTYTVSCKITNGCGLFTTVYTLVSVNGSAPVNPTFNVVSIQNPSCIGDKVYMIPKDGQSSYTYFWDFGDGGKDTTFGAGAIHAFAANGNHTVTVTAKNGCGLTKIINFVDTVKSNSVPSLQQSNGDPIWGIPGGEGGGIFTAGCAGDAIVFYFMGEAANNVWNFGDGVSGTATEHMVVAGGDGGVYPVTIIKHAYASNGTYTVSLTLTNNCGNNASDNMIVNIGGNLAVSGEMSTSPPPFSTCAAVDFIAFGGATYAWDFGDGNTLNSTSPTVSHTYAAQGVYAVTVLITNGCNNSATSSSAVNVTGAGGPAVSLNTSSGPTCVGGSNGSASVNVSSGFPPYTYLWSNNGETTTAVSGLSAGLYYVTVTDDIECASNFAVAINDPAAIVLSSSSTASSCGSSTGTATINVTSGGTGPYTYAWSNGATTSTVSALAWGQYGVTVSDMNGCTSFKNVSVSEAGGATAALNTSTSASCYGSATGALDINVTGGTPPYTYSWSNGSTVQDPSGLVAGTYSVLITDNGSCNATFNASVGEATQIVVTTSVVVAPTCGNFDGKASASPSGGTPPYTYVWSNSTQTTQVITGIAAGTRTVTVTDANGCIKKGVVSLSNSNAPNVSAVVTNVSCNGAGDGSIDITVTGGTSGGSGYLFTWNVAMPATNDEDQTSLVPGLYIVQIQDAANCFSVRSYNITQPDVLAAAVSNTGATCNNNDGTATATPTGGNVPYTYAWTGGQTTQTAVGLALGSKTVTITDSKGCTTSATTTITATTTVQDICIVTVDSTSTKNVIVWEKPAVTNIDSFRIYRDIATVYTRVGAVDFSAPSQFVDNTNGVNPNITSYRYKIAALDNCGGESVMSSYHKTIHLQISPAVPVGYQLNWDDYIGFPVTQYRILRDTNNLGNWVAIDSVPFGITSYTDANAWDSVGFMIEIDNPGGCVISSKNPNSMATNLNSSRSNASRVVGVPTSVNSHPNEVFAFVYPNPSNGVFLVGLPNAIHAAIRVYDVLGNEVRNVNTSGKNKITVDLGKEPKGVYFVQIITQEKIITKKIIIE